jgi:hypothetical protein
LVLPAKNLVAFIKFYDEYSAKTAPQGRTIVFGFSWTLRIPRYNTRHHKLGRL